MESPFPYSLGFHILFHEWLYDLSFHGFHGNIAFYHPHQLRFICVYKCFQQAFVKVSLCCNNIVYKLTTFDIFLKIAKVDENWEMVAFDSTCLALNLLHLLTFASKWVSNSFGLCYFPTFPTSNKLENLLWFQPIIRGSTFSIFSSFPFQNEVFGQHLFNVIWFIWPT